MEREIDRRIGAASAVMRSVYRTVVVKKELSRKAKALDLPVNLRSHPHLWEVFRQACVPPGGGPVGKTQDTLERLYVSRLAWERLGIPPEELEEVSGVREVWASLLSSDCCLRDPVPDPSG
ncbi:hypothetical protein L3Q82_011507 [Scortum barcoo]|uniref:Uncharacterized protein n=1 Tax=Scortum barcoo TaxID=214431 RepID=A0ACB8W5A7_9TELE|nr:hypothetical protein L3Q82_011507 [Scortum barcoo]